MVVSQGGFEVGRIGGDRQANSGGPTESLNYTGDWIFMDKIFDPRQIKDTAAFYVHRSNEWRK